MRLGAELWKLCVVSGVLGRSSVANECTETLSSWSWHQELITRGLLDVRASLILVVTVIVVMVELASGSWCY